MRVAFYMLDGSSFFLCDGIKDKDIQWIFDVCAEKNHDVLLGFSEENQKILKERVGVFKSGPLFMSRTNAAVSPETDQRRKRNKLLLIGAALIVAAGILFGKEYFSFTKDYAKKVNAVSEKERKEMLLDGFTEYKTVGENLERIIDGYEKVDGKWMMVDPVFIFELEGNNDFVLGVSSEETKFRKLGEFCSGFHIFTKNDGEMKEMSGELSTYKVKTVTEKQCKIFDLPKASAKKDFFEGRKKRVITATAAGCIFLLLGVVIIISGTKIKQKEC